MSRYLTPPKISLLVLINLYCDSVVPSSATVPILSFIVSHLVPPATSNPSDRDAPKFVSTIENFENVTITHASSVPGRTLYDLFLKKLWAIDSFDALHSFFDDLSDLLVRTREQAEREAEAGISPPTDRILLSRVSPLGTFVRRAQLEFTRLQFHDASRLWMAFLKFKEPTAATWRKRNPSASATSFDVNLLSFDLEQSGLLLDVAYGPLEDLDESSGLVSTDDVERILEFQTDRLQKLGNRLPDDMKKQFRDMLEPSVTLPSLSHFVKFFDAWRAGNYTDAFDNLHRYFDYTMQTRDKIHYQYALLHMAILQADFGCFDEAIAAINETISTARENQDMTCLNFSLSWLHHLSKAHPRQMSGTGYMGLLGSERDGLAFLKTKARDSKMYNLLSSTLLNEAKLALTNGESVPRALDLIHQAEYLNVRENITSGFGAQFLMQAAVFARLGVGHLSGVYSDIVTHCYGANSPIEEILRAICRSASTIAQAGRYDEALSMLENIDAEVHRTLKFHQYITACVGLLKLKRALRRSDTTSSLHLLTALRPICSSASDPDLKIRLSILEIDYFIRNGSFPRAFNAIEELAVSLKAENADIYWRIHMLTLKATLFAKAGQPLRGFSVAMRAASSAHRARVMPALWEAVGALANVLNELGEFAAARRLCINVLPRGLEGGDDALNAVLYSVLADSYMGMAGKDEEGEERKRASNIAKAEIHIDAARECYKRIQDINGECEMLAKKALIARIRGDDALARDWAENYLSTYERAMQRIREDAPTEGIAGEGAEGEDESVQMELEGNA